MRVFRRILCLKWQVMFLSGMLVVMHTPLAQACGYCIEDRIASVYDHASVSRALSKKHRVLFFALDGRLPAMAMERYALEGMVNNVQGVDPGSAKVSLETASLALSIDPARISFAAVERSLQTKLLLRGISLQLIRVMDKPAEFLAQTTNK